MDHYGCIEIAQPPARGAESTDVWIDRIVSETPEGPDLLELHPRLTVISSTDEERRRGAFERIFRALRAKEGTHLEVRTEYGDRFAALRPKDQEATLVDPARERPVDPTTNGLGIVGQLNSPEEMAVHLRLLHVSVSSLRDRVVTDREMLALARTPIDQLWTLANNIQTDRETLNMTRDRGTDISAAAEERESREVVVSELLALRAENARKFQSMFIGAGIVGVIAVGTLLLSSRLLGALFLFVAAAVAAAGWYFKSAVEDSDEHDDLPGSEFDVQIGRINEMFDTHSLSRKEREAQQDLTASLEMWRELAGSAKPDVLIKERPRIEELASHIRLIDNEPVEGVAETERELLYGFASLLAELGRRFPAERVPLLIDDLFGAVDPQYHSVLRELLTRASNRRQVILESADDTVAQWAAAEAVAGDALLITDQPVSVAEDGTDADHLPAV